MSVAIPDSPLEYYMTSLVIDYGNVSLGLPLIYPNNLSNFSVACNLSSFLKHIYFGLFCSFYYFFKFHHV